VKSRLCLWFGLFFFVARVVQTREAHNMSIFDPGYPPPGPQVRFPAYEAAPPPSFGCVAACILLVSSAR